METFVALIIVVFGVLQIILFFKLWGMTNDVRKLTKQFCESSKPMIQVVKETPITNYDKRLDFIKKGDYVIRVSDGKKMLVSNITDGKLVCSASLLSGAETYRKDQVKIIE